MVKTSQIVLGVSIICYLIGIILVMKYDPFGDNPVAKAMSISLMIFGIFIILFLGFLMNQFRSDGPAQDSHNPIMQIFKNFAIMIFIIGTIFTLSILFIQYFDPSPGSTGMTAYVLNIVLIIGIVSFLVKLIRGDKKLHDDNTIWSLIKNIVLYIPCLVIDVVEYLKYQYNITTKTHWIILAIDIGILLAKDHLPKIKSFLFDTGGKQLLSDPVYLNELRFIAKYNDLVPQPKVNDDHKTTGSKKRHFEYNYAISMWIYINPQPPNTNASYNRYTSLFNFGDKPRILYKAKTNTLKIVMKNGKKDKEEIFKGKIMKLQKWNNFVINYNGGTLDIFLNNELIASKPGVVPYMRFDSIETGSIGGIHGGICNVKYFNNALKKNMVNSIYLTAKDKTPPVV